MPSCRGRRVEGSRLKLAWKAGFDRIQNNDHLTKNGSSSGSKKEDWEDELPSGEKEMLEESFNSMYHIVLDNPVFPCDPLTNRIWREFRRWQMSVTTTSQIELVHHRRELSHSGVKVESPFRKNPVGMFPLQTRGLRLHYP